MTIFLKLILASIMWHGIVYALWVLNDALIMLSFIFPMIVLHQCNLLNKKESPWRLWLLYATDFCVKHIVHFLEDGKVMVQ